MTPSNYAFCWLFGSPGKNGTYRKLSWRRLILIFLNDRDFVVLVIVALDIEAIDLAI